MWQDKNSKHSIWFQRGRRGFAKVFRAARQFPPYGPWQHKHRRTVTAMVAPLCAATLREAYFRVHATSIAITSIAVRSALMRSPHEFHGVFDVAPLSGFFSVAL